MKKRQSWDGRHTEPLKRGQKFGRMIILKTFKRGIIPYAECLCFVCAKFFETPQTRIRCGKRIACERCSFLLKNKSGQNKLDPLEKFLRHKEGQYKHSARKRNYKWFLSQNEFRERFNSSCFYCGLYPAKGVDRRVNEMDYTPENSVSCCTQCNMSKRTLSDLEFLDWIARIAAFQGMTL